jgi:hypothetical protein
VLVSAGIYLALCLWLFHSIRYTTHGYFGFSLDDPYIHMALAEQIAHGFYGINPGEAASPSSSIIWPFLLAPFARFSLPAVVLILNLLAGLGTSVLIGFAAASWSRPTEPDDKPRSLLTVLALILIGNLAGLTFVGMEHTLQVFLAVGAAFGILACLRGERIPTWCLAMAAMGTLVRYESLTIAVALAMALVGLKQTRKALLLLTFSILPIVLFGLFLHHLKLPMLPSSVLVKGQVSGQAFSPLVGLRHSLSAALQMAPTDPYRLPLTIFIIMLAVMAWRESDRARRFAFAGTAIAGTLHLLFGPFYWFYRYEVYIVLFCAIVLLSTLKDIPKIPLGWYALVLLACCHPYIQALHDTIINANDIYLQQYQMHRFSTEFYSGNVAINDLGLVSYRRRPGQYVFDLTGLGSLEAATQKDKTTEWMDAVVREHHVGLVMIYEKWWLKGPTATLPDSWTRLGMLCLPHAPIFLGGPCVTYFATPEEPVAKTQEQFAAYIKTLPAELQVYLPDKGDQ